MPLNASAYPLFEYVFVDPQAIWEDPEILQSMSLKYGHILVQNDKNKIYQQIEQLEAYDRDNADHENELRDIRVALTKLESEGLINAYNLSGDANTNGLKFIEDASEFLDISKEGFCIVTTQNRGVTNGKIKEVELCKFIKESQKSVNIPLTPEDAAIALKPLLDYRVFPCVREINIVDVHVWVITIAEDKDTDNYLEVIEQLCLLLANYFDEKNDIPLKLNIFFSDHWKRDKGNDKEPSTLTSNLREKFYQSSLSICGKKVELNFICLAEKQENKNTIQLLHNRYIFSDIFLIETELGICSENKKKGAVPNRWRLDVQKENEYRPDDLSLKKVQRDYSETTDKYKYMFTERAPIFDE